MRGWRILRGLGVAALFGAVILVTGRASAQNDPKIEKAKRHMENGVTLINDPDGARYEDAFPEFKSAYELSGSLNALQNMAICAMKLERDGEAIEYYETFIKGKGDTTDPDEMAKVEQAKRDLGTLKSTVAWVTVQADKPGVTLSDVRTPSKGSAITNVYTLGDAGQKMGIHPGQHTFTASLAGMADESWPIKLENGSAQEHTFTMKPAVTGGPGEPEMHRPVPAYAWAVGAVSWAMIVPTVALIVRAKGMRDDYEENVFQKKPLGEQQTAADDVKSANLVADIMLGVTGAAVLTSTILFLARPEEPVEPAEEATTARFGVDYTIAPSFDATGGGAFVTGRF